MAVGVGFVPTEAEAVVKQQEQLAEAKIGVSMYDYPVKFGWIIPLSIIGIIVLLTVLALMFDKHIGIFEVFS